MTETVWTPERKTAALTSLANWQGTPHRDRIAIPQVGVDCIQLVLTVLNDAGILPRVTVTGYTTQDGMFSQSDRLKRGFKSCMDLEEIEKENPQFGDIAIFKTGKSSGHCAFYTEKRIWHALARRCVTVSPYNLWVAKIEILLRIKQDGFTSNPQTAAKII